MKDRKKIFFYYLSVFFLTNIFCGIQSTLWYQLFGNFPSPQLWLEVVVYFALFRKSVWNIFFLYFIGVSIASYTALPLSIIWLLVFIVFSFNYLMHNKIFWSGVSYFSLMSFLSILFFEISYWVISSVLEPNSAPFSLMNRTIVVLLTPAFSIPIYFLMQQLDSWFLSKENLKTRELSV